MARTSTRGARKSAQRNSPARIRMRTKRRKNAESDKRTKEPPK